MSEWDIDHIIPWAWSFNDTRSNLQALCPQCHKNKTDTERQQLMNAVYTVGTFDCVNIAVSCSLAKKGVPRVMHDLIIFRALFSDSIPLMFFLLIGK